MYAVRRAVLGTARRHCSTKPPAGGGADGEGRDWLRGKASEWQEQPGEAPPAEGRGAAQDDLETESKQRQELRQGEYKQMREASMGKKVKLEGFTGNDWWKDTEPKEEEEEAEAAAPVKAPEPTDPRRRKESLSMVGDVPAGAQDPSQYVNEAADAALKEHRSALDGARARNTRMTPAEKDAILAKKTAKGDGGPAEDVYGAGEFAITEEAVTAEVHALAEEAQLKPGVEVNLAGVYQEGPFSFVVTEDNYEEKVEAEELPVILDCWAPQCADSIALTAMLKVFVGAVNEQGVKLKVAHLDCNTNYSLTLHIGVQSLPSTMAVKDNEVLEQITGAQDEEGLAQFVFGYVQYCYGEEALEHITEEHPLARLVDARVALKAKDYEVSYEKYSSLFFDMLPTYEKECRVRQEKADQGVEFSPDVTRDVTTAEVLAAKGLMGMAMCCYHNGQLRHCRKLLQELKDNFPKLFRTFGDLRKATATLEILMLSEYKVDDDVEDLEDEERIDQHNLDIKVKLIGAYFIAGDMHKAMSTTFILIRKNREYKHEIGYMLLCRLMMYLGRHHPIRDEYDGMFKELLRMPLSRALAGSSKLSLALNEPGGYNPLEHEIPLMVDTSSYLNELNHTRHPLLR